MNSVVAHFWLHMMSPPQLSTVFLVISGCSYELSPPQIHRGGAGGGGIQDYLGIFLYTQYKSQECCSLVPLLNWVQGNHTDAIS